MGNRAVIAFKCQKGYIISKEMSPAIYLHWNGGRDSVEAFLEAGKKLGVRGKDPTYCIARLTQIIGNWLGGGLGVGAGCYGNLDGDNGDNGVYWIYDWEIVKREFAPSTEQMVHNKKEMVGDVLAANTDHFMQISPRNSIELLEEKSTMKHTRTSYFNLYKEEGTS